jgi:HEPN domain-containing protein
MSDSQIIKEWLRYAHNDLIVAHHSFEDLHPKQTEISCYHCQQCAEKALKGYLIFKDIEPPRIHDLIKLCQMCMEYDNQFMEILDCCIVLNKYSSNIRYPNELVPDDSIAKLAIDKAQQIYDFCVAKIPEIEQKVCGELDSDE